MPDTPSPYTMLAYRRAFSSQDPALVQISFDPRVLDKYRSSAAFTLIRSETAGRISKEGGWTIDVGITNDSIHASLKDLLDNLPDEEREHWAMHLVTLPLPDAALGRCLHR
jgi:hypothetical protein